MVASPFSSKPVLMGGSPSLVPTQTYGGGNPTLPPQPVFYSGILGPNGGPVAHDPNAPNVNNTPASNKNGPQPVANPGGALGPQNPNGPVVAKTLTAAPDTTVKKTPAKKPQSALDKWLAGDTDYQQQLAEFNQQQQAYQQQYNSSTNQQNQNYNATQRGMNTQAATDRQNQQYDFAGRGVLQSGVFAQALDQYNTTFNQNMNNLTQGNTQALASDKDQLNSFLRELTLQKNSAKQDAIRRRAQTLGI